MSRKPQKKDAREQSTRQLMGIDDITDYGIATRMGELVFFAIKPTNISVLPDTGVGARNYTCLLNRGGVQYEPTGTAHSIGELGQRKNKHGKLSSCKLA